VTRRRLVWLVLILAVVAAILAGAALLVLPRFAREAAIWQLQALTGRPVALDALDVSLTDGRFSARGFRVTDHDGGLLAEFDRLEGDFHPASLLGAHLRIGTLVLTNGRLRIVRLGPNRFNVSDLLERPAAPRSAFDVSVDRFTLAGGAVALEDRTLTPMRTWRSDDIRLQAQDVTTLAPRGTAFGTTTIAGALLTLRVEALQLAPVHLRAQINVRDLDLRLAALYVPPGGVLGLEGGALHAGVDVVLDARDGLLVDAEAVVERLALRRPGMADDDVTAPEVRILVREFQQRAESLALRYASLEGDITVLDSTTTPPRRLTFSDLTVTASGIEDVMKAQAQVAVHATLPGGGEVDAGGIVGVATRRADLRVRARRLELAALAPSLPLRGRLDGIATADVRVVASHDPALELTVTGDARLERVALGDGSRTPITAARVAATALRYTWPATVAVDRLTVTQPSLTVERDAAGAINLAALVGRPADPEMAGDAGPARPAPPDLRVAELNIENGRAMITDASSGSRIPVARLAMTARDLAWPARGPVAVELSAAVAGADVSARGTVEAAKPRADIALVVRGADLATLQPWLPTDGRLGGVLSRTDLRVVAAHEGALAITAAGDATLEGLALGDGSRTLARAARATADGIDYTWPATVRVAQLTLTTPFVAVERDAAGAINLAALGGPAAEASAEAAVPAPGTTADVVIGRLGIEGGHLSLTDAATGGSAQMTSIAFTGSDLTWPARGTSQIRLAGALAGGQATARGTVDGAQRRGEVALTLRGVDLATLQPWLPISGHIRGAADADVTVMLGLEPFTLALRGAVGATDLAFLEGTRPLLTVGSLNATGLELQWPTRLAIDRLHVKTPWAQIERNPQGELSLRAIFRPRLGHPGAAAAAQPGDAAGSVAGLQVSVREALFENGGTNIVDDAVEPAARFEVRGSRLDVRNLTWPAQGPASVQLSTPMPGSGTLKAQGTFSIEPTELQLEAELDQVDLAPGRPYLPVDARLNGRLSGRAKVNGTFGDTISLAIDGDAAVDRLGLGDADRRLATVQRAELTGLRYQYPTSVRIRELSLRRPWALVERSADGALELASLLTARRQFPARAGTPGAASAPIPPARIRVALHRLTLEEGFLRFVDRTTNPHYAEELSKITLTAEGIGTSPRQHGTLDLRGTLASGNPLTVRGQVGGLAGPRFLDLTVEVKHFPVPRLNPYLDRLSTWISRQGTMTASLRYKLDGDELEASNDITLDDLELETGGRGNEVQRRVGLPLGLLVSLLKDRQGDIHLSIPVRGRLSAPDFDYSEAMWTAVRNLAIRLVSLPFSWVGNMFYTEDARIESIQVYPVTFQTARATPTVAGGEQLQRLATFLKESPALRLRLRPVTTVADVAVLRREALEARLAAAGADASARRQAAVALYAELFPRRQPPASDEALLDELVRETPTPPRALRTLSTGRTAAIRDALTVAGVAGDRLEPAESRAAVEREGDARMEFEIIR
jgi:uncharacterized protein involved in outer membrane biogenesis